MRERSCRTRRRSWSRSWRQRVSRCRWSFHRSRASFATDVTKVRQILLNLLTNAGKFTERGSVRCQLRAGRRDGGRRRERYGAWDRERATSDHVFDSFWQGGSMDRERPEGVGLGLSVSRRLAQLLGGEITVASVPGRGSTFSVRLPRCGPNDNGVTPAHSRRHHDARPHVVQSAQQRVCRRRRLRFRIDELRLRDHVPRGRASGSWRLGSLATVQWPTIPAPNGRSTDVPREGARSPRSRAAPDAALGDVRGTAHPVRLRGDHVGWERPAGDRRHCRARASAASSSETPPFGDGAKSPTS